MDGHVPPISSCASSVCFCDLRASYLNQDGAKQKPEFLREGSSVSQRRNRRAPTRAKSIFAIFLLPHCYPSRWFSRVSSVVLASLFEPGPRKAKARFPHERAVVQRRNRRGSKSHRRPPQGHPNTLSKGSCGAALPPPSVRFSTPILDFSGVTRLLVAPHVNGGAAPVRALRSIVLSCSARPYQPAWITTCRSSPARNRTAAAGAWLRPRFCQRRRNTQRSCRPAP
jgi:hypothetical protein